MKKYQKKNDIQHVYDIPDTYIGNVSFVDDEDFLYNIDENKYYKKTFSKCEGIERLFLEIISNAGNNIDETRREAKDPGTIFIKIKNKYISIKNTGNIIPIERNTENPEYWNPEMIFGVMRTSSNYDTTKPRMGCGRNGFGAKLVNIFSKHFIVKVCDVENKLLYTGEWTDNMSTKVTNEVTKIKPKKKDKSYVKVKWLLDFERFKIQDYSTEMIESFARYAVDFSFTCKTDIYFNQKLIRAQRCEDFIKYFLEESDQPSRNKKIIYYEWEPDFKPLEDEKINYNHHIPRIEAILVDTPDKGTIHSYVNGLITIDGGSHVDSFTKTVYKQIADMFCQKFDKKDVKPKDVKKHLTLILNCRLANPIYTSQSKTKLGSPNLKFDFPEENYKKIFKWDCIEAMQRYSYLKFYDQLKKTDGKKSRHIVSDNGEDANLAGGKQSQKCDFYIIEGNSATQYAKLRRSLIGGKDNIGYCAIRGKPLNVSTASLEKLHNNKELTLIKKYLGLCEGVDYTQPENRNKLRYGKVVICTDADTDGLHICQILSNFFGKRFPSLLQNGMIYRLEIAMIKIYDKKGRVVERFYSEQEYEKHKDEYPERRYDIQYFKGLATSSPDDVRDDIFNASLVQFEFDIEALNTLNFALDPKYRDVRKIWIEEFDPKVNSNYYDYSNIQLKVKNEILKIPTKKQEMTDFIKTKGILYTMDTLIRCIPMINDGLKESQRKLIYYALKNLKPNSKPVKVAIFSAKASSETNYRHGPDPLEDNVMKLTASYTGSNNLPFFKAKGLFATRDDCGNKRDVPVGRYPNIQIQRWCEYAFLKQLIELVPNKVEENIMIEPTFIPCIIPIALINGFSGIATGHSTECPNYSLTDILRWLRSKLNNTNEKVKVRPFYRGFTGEMKIDNNLVYEIVEPEEKDEQDEEKIIIQEVEVDKGKSLKTFGIYKILENGDLEITELPIGLSFKTYRRFLEKMVEEKKIKSFRDNSTTEIPHYVLKDVKIEPLNHQTLFLVKSISLSNIKLINEYGQPKHYHNVYQVLEEYYQIILSLFSQLYQTRRDELVQKIETEKLSINFIQKVVAGDIQILGKARDEIKESLILHEIPYSIYQKTGSEDYCTDKIKDLKKHIKKLEQELDEMSSQKPEDSWSESLDVLENILQKDKLLD